MMISQAFIQIINYETIQQQAYSGICIVHKYTSSTPNYS